jgi:hypothetical protein
VIKKAVVLYKNESLEVPMRKWLSVSLLVFCLLPRLVLAACDQPTSVVQLSDASRLAEEAFAKLDADGLLTQSSLARSQILPCVQEIITKRNAAAFHRLMALEAFINGNESRVVSELHAALILEPGYLFPENVAGPGHPLLALYKRAETSDDGVAERTYPPANGYMMVAGVRNAARHSKTPVIIQAFGPHGELLETRYVQPGEASPNWSGNVFGLTAEDLGIKHPLLDSKPWYIAGTVTLVASAVLYGIALNQKHQYTDPATSDDQRPELENRVNGLGTASVITGASGVLFTGLGISFRFGLSNQKGTKKNRFLQKEFRHE